MESTRTLATKSISQCYCFSAPSQCHSFSLMSHCGKSCIDTLCIATRLSRARTWPHKSNCKQNYAKLLNQTWFNNISNRHYASFVKPVIWIHLMHAAVQPGTLIKHSGLQKWIGLEDRSCIDRPTSSDSKLIISGAALMIGWGLQD